MNTPEEFRVAAHQAVDWIADYLRDVGKLPVVPNVQPGDLIRSLPASGPEVGVPMEAILDDFRSLIVPGITHWNHPRFLAYFSTSGSAPGILGEMLAAALNVNQMLWKTSPAPTELEQVTLGWLRQWLGLPDDFFGIIHDTASTGTLHAVLAARELAAPGARLSGDAAGLTLYTSEHAHSSVDKTALTLGIGLANIRHVPTDEEFRMRPDALDGMIQQDRAQGKKPFCIVATVGTTSAGSVDPVVAMAGIAKRHGLWLHVDAAYAGPAAILDEHRHILEGTALADSVVVNPHKWLFTPVDLSALYTRRPDVMRRAVSLGQTPVYLEMSDGTDAMNLADYSLALGRRFRSLKLWFVLRHFGRQGITEVLRRHMDAAQAVASRIAAHPDFELAAPVLFSLVCFRYRGTDADNRALLEQVNTSGQAFLSGTVLRGQFVLRMAIGNVATAEADVFAVWDILTTLSGSLTPRLSPAPTVPSRSATSGDPPAQR